MPVPSTTNNSKPPVQEQRKELYDVLDRYETISDSIEGEHKVKSRGKKYLPVPSSCSSTTDDRYKAYLLRANYFNVCQPTRDALKGQIFLRPPIVKLPEGLEFLIDDVDGEGTTFQQLAEQSADYVIPFGRGGFLTEFPPTNKEVTQGQVDSGEVRPIIKFTAPWSMRNWLEKKNKTKSNVKKLTMLVIDEAVEQVKTDNEFEIETVIHQRVYRLDDNECATVEIYDEDGNSTGRVELCEQTGNHQNTIPFDPIGSKNNDMEIDEPPFTGLSNLNIAHFRNSADYEASVFFVGQVTPWFSGMTQDWMDEYYPDGKIPFGSGVTLQGPPDSEATLLQGQPNMIAFEAMTHKEKQMFAIGAKIVDKDQKVEKKEAEIENESAAQKSVLMTIKNNLELALFRAVQRAGALLGIEVTKENTTIELNGNFDLSRMNAAEVMSYSDAYQKGEITFGEMRAGRRRQGSASISDDEEAKKQIMEDKKLKEALNPPQEPKPTVGNGKPNPERKQDDAS